MGPTDQPPYHIRPYRRCDRAAVRRICVATSWMGRSRPDVHLDEFIWAEFWTRYFTDRQRSFSWVACRDNDGRVVGYLTGTPSAARADAFLPWVLPGIIGRVLWKRILRDPIRRRLAFDWVKSIVRAETAIPEAILKEYPATWHFNLLPEARRQGLGSAMLETFLDVLGQRGLPGIHAQAISLNDASIATCRRMGMRLLHAAPLPVFASIDPRPMEAQVWGKKL